MGFSNWCSIDNYYTKHTWDASRNIFYAFKNVILISMLKFYDIFYLYSIWYHSYF